VVGVSSTRSIRITVRGRLSDRLAATFEGMTPLRRAGSTELVGEVTDQAQLHGLLSRIRDLGLELESVTVGGPERASGAERRPRRLRPGADVGDTQASDTPDGRKPKQGRHRGG
jgi:hypothetical protein